MNKIRKVILLFILLFMYNLLFAQSIAPEPSQDPKAAYRLFKTMNMWTFIKLNTITGQMWQIQYGFENDNRGSYVLNSLNLASKKKQILGRFTLYPTSNMYTFILLDQIDGNTWQVQWSMDEQNRLVIPISN